MLCSNEIASSNMNDIMLTEETSQPVISSLYVVALLNIPVIDVTRETSQDARFPAKFTAFANMEFMLVT